MLKEMPEMRIVRIVVALAVSATSMLSAADVAAVKIASGECWWGAANFFGTNMPFTAKTNLKIDLRRRNYSNQCASLLISDQGRVIWADAQSEIAIEGGTITMDADSPVSVAAADERTLAGAYRHAMRRWFPPSGRAPDPRFFTSPQLNTWIELTYHQNQKDILAYAKTMVAHGIEPGVLMIDDTWQTGYGDWRFDATRFPDPKAMVGELHAMGFKVMLWMCPYVGMDTPAFRRIAWGQNPDDVRGYADKGGFLLERNPAAPGEGEYNVKDKPKACGWWNGYSAFLDFSHPNANAWFTETLDGLVRDFGVDGFKLDGADLGAYGLGDRKTFDPKATNGSLNNGYCAYALKYPFCEVRNTWRMQQAPVVVRLHDKMHEWGALARIVADMIGAGLLGQPFICPDMVGGGDWMAFIPGSPFEQELFIRSAQIHALSPMMQISASPWRVLDAEHQAVFTGILSLRRKFAPKIAALAEKAGRDGEPILRNLEYNYPGMGYAGVIDEFMLGDDLLVAPVMQKGARERKVVVPPGRWLADDGAEVVGPCEMSVSAPLARLPHFVLKREANDAASSKLFRTLGCEKGKLCAISDEAVSRLDGMFARRVAAIRATPNMDVPESAPRRYLSPRGDDAADGLAPATAWRTTERLNAEKLAPGSFVLFERGGVYRGGVKVCSGVTYTAYGVGEKPRVYASPWDGADPAKWEKTDAPDIWRCRVGTEDVGTIVFDGGRTNAVKIVPVCNRDGTFTQQYGGRPFGNGYRSLAEDLHFWHDYSAKTKFQPHARGTGFLYLRSHENPGSRFKSVEFCTRRHGFAVGRCGDVTIDNICVMYVGAHGVGAGTVKNLRVANCEFGWIGGSIQSEGIFGRNWPTRFGNGVEIYGGCDGFTVENCYVHDIYDAGLTQQFGMHSWEGGSPVVQRNVRYSRNAIERCNYSIEYFLHGIKDPAANPSRIEGFTIDDNLMRDAADGFCRQRPDLNGGAHIKCWRYSGRLFNNRASGYVIRNNVMAGSRDMLVEISSSIMNPDGSDSMPKMEGNVFVGRLGQRFGVLNQGKAAELKYDADGVSRLAQRYGNNAFAVHAVDGDRLH